MIPAQIAQEAITLAEQLEAANRRVTVVGGTPLAQLLSLTCVNFQAATPSVIVGDTPVDEYVPIAANIEAESRYPSVENANMSQHDEVMDASIQDHSTAVGNHLTFAKNTVRPLIKEFVDMAASQLAAYPDQGSYTPTVVRIDLPEVGQLAQIEREAESFKEGLYRPLNNALRLPPMEAADVIALMKTGATAVDSAIDLWVEQAGEGFFLNAYNVGFCSSAQGVVTTPEQLLFDKVSGPSNLVAMFLMARRLLESPPAESGMGLNEYKIAVGEMVEQLGLRLSTAYDDRARNITQQNLILASDKETAYVFAPVYDQWIAEGGNTAVLFGNLLLDRPNTSVPAMAVDAVECLERWERQNRFLTVTLQNRKAEAAKEAFRFCALKVIGDNLDKCFDGCTNNQALTMDSSVVVEALKAVNDFLLDLDNEELKDLWYVGIEVVAGCIFSRTAAYDILKGLEDAVRNNPGIDPGEAALLSTVDYVCTYVAGMMAVQDL